MNMKQRSMTIGSLAVIALSLAACGGSNVAPSSSTTSPPTSAPSPPTTVAPSSTTSTTTVVTQSACQITQLRIMPGASGGAVGNVGQTILFTNESQTTCTMSGYPGVAALDAQGNQVAQAQRKLTGMLGGLQNTGTPIPLVTLTPGEVASAEVEGTDNPIGTAASCTYYPSFLVTPPGETHSVKVSAGLAGSSIPGFPGCTPIGVNPVVPGSTGRLGP